MGIKLTNIRICKGKANNPALYKPSLISRVSGGGHLFMNKKIKTRLIRPGAAKTIEQIARIAALEARIAQLEGRVGNMEISQRPLNPIYPICPTYPPVLPYVTYERPYWENPTTC